MKRNITWFRFLPAALSLTVLTLWIGQARAAEKTICVEIDTQFADEEADGFGGGGVTDTRFGNINTNSSYFQRARGIKVEVNGQAMYTSDGKWGGCVTVEVGSATQVPFKVFAEARVNGLRVQSYAQRQRGTSSYFIPWWTPQDSEGNGRPLVLNSDDVPTLVTVPAASMSCQNPNFLQDNYVDEFGNVYQCDPYWARAGQCDVYDMCGQSNNAEYYVPYTYTNNDGELVSVPSYCMKEDMLSVPDENCLPRDWSDRQAWHQLAVGMYSLYRTRWNLEDYGVVCGYTPTEYLQWAPNDQPGPATQWPDDLVVFYAPYGKAGGGNGWNAPNPWSQYSKLEGTVRGGLPGKYIIAHELGHMLVEKRTGGYTHHSGSAAPVCGCSAGGRMDRFHSAHGAREGWAEFYTAWVWNDTEDEYDEDLNPGTPPECTMSGSAIQDFNIDKVQELKYQEGRYSNLYDCERFGPIGGQNLSAHPIGDEDDFECSDEMNSSGYHVCGPVNCDPAECDTDGDGYLDSDKWYTYGDNQNSWVQMPGWLETAYEAADWDGEDENQCGNIDVDEGCDEYFGVSTIYDWMRYYWDMVYQEGVSLQELADIHVDMCPIRPANSPDGNRGEATWLIAPDWRYGVSWNDTPECRLRFSSIVHGRRYEHYDQSVNGVANVPFEWSCNNESSVYNVYYPSESVCGDGVCSDFEDSGDCRQDCAWKEGIFDSTYAFGPLTIETTFTDFGVYGAESVAINDRAEVSYHDGSRASVGSGDWQTPGYGFDLRGDINLGVDAIAGSLHSGGTIFVRGGIVDGGTFAKRVLTAQLGSEFHGPVRTGLVVDPSGFCSGDCIQWFNFDGWRDRAPQYIAWTMNEVDFDNFSGNEISIANGQTVKLHPKETYRGERITVYGGGEIVLGAGIYSFAKLRLEPDALMTMDTSEGAIFLFIDETFSLQPGAEAVTSTSDPSKVMLVARGSVYLAPGVSWHGTVISGGMLNIERNTLAKIEGLFYGNEVVVHQDTDLRIVPFGPDPQGLYNEAVRISEGTFEDCGNSVCDPWETCSSCPQDCGGCCGDGVCNGGENCGSCAQDCDCCGNGSCDSGESCETCATDCGPCTCGDGECNNGETCSGCEVDCGPCEYCGDGVCNNGETCSDCEVDCGPCEYCGDGVCNNEETCQDCEADCGSCGGVIVPARIEAEEYSRAYETTSPGTNDGGACDRGDGVDMGTAEPAGNCVVGWTYSQGAGQEWLEFDVYSSDGGEYDITSRAAAGATPSGFTLEVIGQGGGVSVYVPNNGWNSYSDLVTSNVFLAPGANVLRVTFTGYANLDWIDIAEADGGGGGGTGCTCPSGCGAVVNASVPHTVDGSDNTCYFFDTLGSFINNWNNEEVTINGIDITNAYMGSGSYPDEVDGGYYIYNRSAVPWGHLEVL